MDVRGEQTAAWTTVGGVHHDGAPALDPAFVGVQRAPVRSGRFYTAGVGASGRWYSAGVGAAPPGQGMPRRAVPWRYRRAAPEA